MELCHRHTTGGRTEADFELASNGELMVQLEYIGRDCYQRQDVSITLTKEETERLSDILLGL